MRQGKPQQHLSKAKYEQWRLALTCAVLEAAAPPVCSVPAASKDVRLVSSAGSFLLHFVNALKLRPSALLSSKAPATMWEWGCR